MINQFGFSNMSLKYVNIKTSLHLSRFMGSREQIVWAQNTGSGDSIKMGNSIEPVKMAYTSYESTKPSFIATDWPVIIMHGLLGSKANWNAMSKMLHNQTNRKIFAVDARNHGDSPHTNEMTYTHLVEDLRALMGDLNIEQATFVGHSMGGRAMMLMALRYPELVEKLVIVDISPVTVSSTMFIMPRYFEGMLSVKLDRNIPLSKARKMADEQLARYVLDSGTRQFILTNLVEDEGGCYKWRINLDSISRNFGSLATFPPVGASCPVPTLFVTGANSDYVRSEDHDEIRRIFPAAKFKTIPGAGHWVHADKPNELLGILRGFIQNIETIEENS